MDIQEGCDHYQEKAGRESGGLLRKGGFGAETCGHGKEGLAQRRTLEQRPRSWSTEWALCPDLRVQGTHQKIRRRQTEGGLGTDDREGALNRRDVQGFWGTY